MSAGAPERGKDEPTEESRVFLIGALRAIPLKLQKM